MNYLVFTRTKSHITRACKLDKYLVHGYHQLDDSFNHKIKVSTNLNLKSINTTDYLHLTELTDQDLKRYDVQTESTQSCGHSTRGVYRLSKSGICANLGHIPMV